MDQSISLMGELGKAKRVDFAPLRAVPVPLPPGACFVIANTLVTSDKQGERRGEGGGPPAWRCAALIARRVRPLSCPCRWPQ